jgi:hypothetical protein
MSGESGWRVLQDNIRRVAFRAGAIEQDLKNLLVGIKLPRFGRIDHAAALDATIKSTGAEVVFIDCFYLCGSGGDRASNLFSMGDLLQSVGEVFAENDCTLVLLHHSPKHIPPGSPLELDNLAFAGAAEFAAQWALLNRVVPYEPGSGHHELWLTIGARAGHGGLHGLVVDEGEFHEGQQRDWRVRVLKPEEMRQDRAERQDEERATKAQQTTKRNADKILRVLAKHPDGETERTIRDATAMSGQTYKNAVAWLLDQGAIAECEIRKPCRKKPYPGYRLTD